jgi:hypothetical protein
VALTLSQSNVSSFAQPSAGGVAGLFTADVYGDVLIGQHPFTVSYDFGLFNSFRIAIAPPQGPCTHAMRTRLSCHLFLLPYSFFRLRSPLPPPPLFFSLVPRAPLVSLTRAGQKFMLNFGGSTVPTRLEVDLTFAFNLSNISTASRPDASVNVSFMALEMLDGPDIFRSRYEHLYHCLAAHLCIPSIHHLFI